MDLGSTANEITGSGNSILSKTTKSEASDNVSPVVTFFSPIHAAMSPALTSLISSLLLECICTILPILSFSSLTVFTTPSPWLRTPEYTLINVKFPTKGSVAILKASAEKGSSSLDDLLAGASVLGLTPSIAFTSSGAGKNSITASKTA